MSLRRILKGISVVAIIPLSNNIRGEEKTPKNLIDFEQYEFLLQFFAIKSAADDGTGGDFQYSLLVYLLR